jgi:uncharacterized membrane protein (DUF106 family)
LAKLRKEAKELAKAKKRLLVLQQEAEAAKEIQRQKAEIAKLQEELRAKKQNNLGVSTSPRPSTLYPTIPISQSAMSF